MGTIDVGRPDSFVLQCLFLRLAVSVNNDEAKTGNDILEPFCNNIVQSNMNTIPIVQLLLANGRHLSKPLKVTEAATSIAEQSCLPLIQEESLHSPLAFDFHLSS
jgi:hypothetical protein